MTTSTPTTTTYALRGYQSTLIRAIYEQWHHAPRVMAQLPTSGGKTVGFATIADEFTRRGEFVLVLAHRSLTTTLTGAGGGPGGDSGD
jgi:superfamily II DNA or RNA helicase